MLKRIALLLLLAAGLPWALQAQSSAPKWMPDSVYYLMPRTVEKTLEMLSLWAE